MTARPEYMVVEYTESENLLLFGRNVIGRIDTNVNSEFIENALNEAYGKQRAAIESARVADD